MALIQLTTSITLAYSYAAVIYPALKGRTRLGLSFGIFVSVPVLAFPLLIESTAIQFRALASFLCAELLFRAIDHLRRSGQGKDHASWGKYAKSLVPFPILLAVGEKRFPRGTASFAPGGVAKMVAAFLMFASGFLFVWLVSFLEWARAHFLLDHAIKFLIFVYAIEAIARAFYYFEHLLGFKTSLPIDDSFRSLTVAEYWQRYNTRIHEWLNFNVFQTSGGRRHPVRAILLCFVVSAVIHEVMFAVATSRLDGYQFFFFMVQAPAVLASRRMAQFARANRWYGRLLVRASTLVWFYFTSMFFFHGVNRVFTFFYVSDPWLP